MEIGSFATHNPYGVARTRQGWKVIQGVGVWPTYVDPRRAAYAVQGEAEYLTGLLNQAHSAGVRSGVTAALQVVGAIRAEKAKAKKG